MPSRIRVLFLFTLGGDLEFGTVFNVWPDIFPAEERKIHFDNQVMRTQKSSTFSGQGKRPISDKAEGLLYT